MKSLFFTIVFIVTVQNLFSQFQNCNSSTNSDLHDIWFIDQNVGVAVGDSGTIVRSVDGGLNWTLVMNDDTVSFKKVKFFDELRGIAIGTDIYITNDAGLSWSNVPYTNDYYFDIEILNQTTCLISGHPTSLIKSTDAGASFFNLMSQSNYNMGLLSFVNENIGYACNLWTGGPSATLKTVNGGISWKTIPSSPNVNTVMEAMSFVSESVGFKGGWYSPYLQKTTDSANAWNFVNYTDSISSGQLIDFHIEQNMPNSYYACGWYGQIYKSTDGGDNWMILNSGLSSTTKLYGIYFISDSVGWAVGVNGTIVKTTTGGQVLSVSEVKEKPNLILFPNPSKEWLNINNPNDLEITQIEVYNPNGQRLVVKNNHNRIDLKSLAKGLYLIKIKTNKGVYIERIVKE